MSWPGLPLPAPQWRGYRCAPLCWNVWLDSEGRTQVFILAQPTSPTEMSPQHTSSSLDFYQWNMFVFLSFWVWLVLRNTTSLVLSILLRVTQFCSSLWVNRTPLSMCVTFFFPTHSSVHGHLGPFHKLVIMSSTIIHTAGHLPLCSPAWLTGYKHPYGGPTDRYSCR